MGLVIREGKRAFATRSQLFPVSSSWLEYTWTEKEEGALGQAGRAAETTLLTAMQNSPSPNLHGEQEKKTPQL